MLSRFIRSQRYNLPIISKKASSTVRLFHTQIVNPFFEGKDIKSKEEPKQGRANEIIEAVLYGSKKIREIENQTHSKMLARGKYVHELQCKFFFFTCE